MPINKSERVPMNRGIEAFVDDCRTKLAAGESPEAILTFLRRNNCSKPGSIRVLMLMKDLSLAEAKELVHLSEAWKDTRERDDDFHDRLEATSMNQDDQ